MMMRSGGRAAIGMVMRLHRMVVHRAAVMHVHGDGRDRKIDIKTRGGSGSERKRCAWCEDASEIAERNQPPCPDPNRSRHAQKHVAQLSRPLRPTGASISAKGAPGQARGVALYAHAYYRVMAIDR